MVCVLWKPSFVETTLFLSLISLCFVLVQWNLTSGTVEPFLGSGSPSNTPADGSRSSATFGLISAAALSADATALYFLDTAGNNHIVRRYNFTADSVMTIAGYCPSGNAACATNCFQPGFPNEQCFGSFVDLVVSPDHKFVYILDIGGGPNPNVIWRYRTNDSYFDWITTDVSAQANSICMSPDGQTIYWTRQFFECCRGNLLAVISISLLFSCDLCLHQSSVQTR